MTGRSKNCPANHTRPEGVRNPNAGAEIEQLQFARTRSRCMNRAPSAGDKMQNRHQSHQRSAYVDRRLHDVGPDHGSEPAFKRIDDRQCGDDGNGGHFSRPQRNRHHNRYGVNSHALRRRPCQQK